jgi:N-methylhydantoinase A
MGLPAEHAAEQAASGIIDLANEHMARALRVISVQRGIDPRSAHLCSFGGAGGLHVCALADALGMTRAIVPERAGVLSALGMLVAPPGRLLTRTWLGPLAARDDAEVAAELDALAQQGVEALAAEGIDPAWTAREDSVDLRYRGQSYTLNLPWQGKFMTADAFADLHRVRYGHDLELPVELVNLRLRLTAPVHAVTLPDAALKPAEGRRVRVAGCDLPVPVLARAAVGFDQDAALCGPALILDDVATTWLASGWRANRDRAGNLLLCRADLPNALATVPFRNQRVGTKIGDGLLPTS